MKNLLRSWRTLNAQFFSPPSAFCIWTLRRTMTPGSRSNISIRRTRYSSCYGNLYLITILLKTPGSRYIQTNRWIDTRVDTNRWMGWKIEFAFRYWQFRWSGFQWSGFRWSVFRWAGFNCLAFPFYDPVPVGKTSSVQWSNIAEHNRHIRHNRTNPPWYVCHLSILPPPPFW